MKFTTIDFDSWSRNQMFYYFSKMAPTGYSLTVNMDVTALRRILKQENRKFFPTYLWLVTKCLNRQQEFKLAYREDVLGYYDTLTPLYAHFHDDDHTFSMMWTEYSDDYSVFYDRYLKNAELFGSSHGVLSQPLTPPPENAYTISSVPWISFTHFAVHSYENKAYFFPSVEARKIFESDGKQLLPLSLTCHHAAADGYHLDRFLRELQEEMDHFRP